MGNILGIGAGAGLVSALLFAVVTTGNPLALILYFVAPLPIYLAALGWNHRAGLTAVAAGGVAIAAVFTPLSGLAFAVSVALPAWWLAYLALLARTENGVVEWYPIGRILMWASVVSAAMTLAIAVALGRGDYDTFVGAFERAVQVIEQLNPNAFQGMSAEDRTKSLRDLAVLIGLVAPPASAAVGVGSTVLLLWIAGRVVRASGRLPRPWPYIPAATLPGVALVVLGASALASVVLGGFPGLGARSLAASLVMAYCLQGLAVLHVLTVGVGGRAGLLIGVYVIFVMLPGWPILFYALLGIADAVFGLRLKRLAKGPPGPLAGPPPLPPA